MNPLLNILESRNQNQNYLTQILSLLKTAQDPVGKVNQMAQTDPRMKQVNDVINTYGGLQQAVCALAKQKGIDVNDVLKQAQAMG